MCANAKSVFPILDGHEAYVAAGAALILMALNLRGVRESGTFFAIPTYCFMFGILSMVIYGLFKILVLGEPIAGAQRAVRHRAGPAVRRVHRVRRWSPCWPEPSPPAARR